MAETSNALCFLDLGRQFTFHSLFVFLAPCWVLAGIPLGVNENRRFPRIFLIPPVTRTPRAPAPNACSPILIFGLAPRKANEQSAGSSRIGPTRSHRHHRRYSFPALVEDRISSPDFHGRSLLVHHQRPGQHLDPVPEKPHRNRPRQIERVLLIAFLHRAGLSLTWRNLTTSARFGPRRRSVGESQPFPRFSAPRCEISQAGSSRAIGRERHLPRSFRRPPVFNPGRRPRCKTPRPESAATARCRNRPSRRGGHGGWAAQIFTLNGSPCLSDSANPAHQLRNLFQVPQTHQLHRRMHVPVRKADQRAGNPPARPENHVRVRPAPARHRSCCNLIFAVCATDSSRPTTSGMIAPPCVIAGPLQTFTSPAAAD